MGQIVGALALLAICAGIFLAVRARLRRAPHLRARLIVLAGAFVLLGAFLGLYLPTKVPDTAGSPASMVAVIVLWLSGAVLALIGLPALAAAVLGGGRPDPAEHP
jgi:uncharacterized membrane protein YozB (DUF420 family)